MKKLFAWIVAIPVLVTSFPVHATTGDELSGERRMPEETPLAALSQEAVNAKNAVLDVVSTQSISAADFQISFMKDLNGQSQQVRVEDRALTFVDALGHEYTGIYNPAESTGLIITGSGKSLQVMTFKFASLPDGSMALERFDRVGVQAFATYFYGADNRLTGYRGGAIFAEAAVYTDMARVNDDAWSLDYQVLSAGQPLISGKAALDSAQTDDLINMSWLVQVLRAREAAYQRTEPALTDTNTRIESYRNAEGGWEARVAIVQESDGENRYVLENPQDATGELILQDRPVSGIDGATARFGAHLVDGVYMGAGLLITLESGEEVYVDYPSVREVTVDDRVYDLQLQGGIVELREQEPVLPGQTSPYQSSEPANLVLWDLQFYPSQDPRVPPVPGGDDLDRIEIYRKAPGSSTQELVATLHHMTNQFLDRQIDPALAAREGYEYSVYITIRSGIRKFVPVGVERINYGRDADFAEGDLRPENVLVIASAVSSANGRQKSLLPDGSDLVDYYMQARGIPAANVIRLNIQDNATFTNYNDFKTRVLDPIHQHLVANGLEDKITAFTTMPGTHTTYRAVRPLGFGLTYDHIPLESIISDSIPKMLRGEKPSFTFQVNSVNGGQPFEDIYGYRYSPVKDQPDLDLLLESNLGYTRMAAPATSTLTAQQNLKRMIDQSIAAENQARLAAENGVAADHYTFIFDSRGAKIDQTDLLGSSQDYGDYRFMSAEQMLRDFGYTTYLDKKEATLDGTNTVADAQLVADLASGEKVLQGYGGWYFPGNGNFQDDPTDRYNPIYNYMESLSPDGFADGSFITPLDSDKESGWFALKRDGVVMAVNAQNEPYVDGLADVVGAYVFTGTSLAFAAVKAQKYTHWYANIFGDPLFNMGKNILGTPRTSVVDGQVLSTQIVQAGKLEAAGTIPDDYIGGARLGRIEYSYDSTGRIVQTLLPDGGRETYFADGTKTYLSVTGREFLEFDASGRIVRRTRTVFNWTTGQDETIVQTYSYSA